MFELQPGAVPDGYYEALIPLDDAKDQCGILLEEEEFDARLTAIRNAAIDQVEGDCAIAMGPRTGLVCTAERLPLFPALPVRPVTAITACTLAGVAQPVETLRIGSLGRLLGASWAASAGPIALAFDAGYAAGQCPPALIQAARLLLAHWFEQREAVAPAGRLAEVPLGVTWLYGRFRVPTLA